ncbi:MAG: cation:proton antiporter [Planctomycetes bacterium]|nr:cation:proton antiporter [Planctomycetota bacterium]
MERNLYLLVLLITAGVGAQWLAARLRFPVILLLLVIGMVAGPCTGVLVPEQLFGDLLSPFITLTVAVVMFEGGLTLDLAEARHVGRALLRMILGGLVLGFGLTTALAHYVGGLTVGTSAVLGAILVVTGPTVILPLLRGARIAARPAALLRWEGIVNDPLGALLALFVLEAVRRSRADAGWSLAEHALGFAGTAAGAGLLGLLMGFALHRALDRGWIAEHIKSPVIFASVLLVFGVSDLFGHESGLLAVTVMGLVLTNVANAHVEDVRRFKEQFTSLLVSVLFVLQSARLNLTALSGLWGWPLLVILGVVFVVRPLVVATSLAGSALPGRERILLGWIAPRGVVAAAVAGAFGPELIAAGCADGHLLEPLVFGVIISTVLLHGLSLRPLARRLHLAHQDGSGVLVVGASAWAVALSQRLAEAGATVVLADRRHGSVSRARMEGLEVHHGDVLAEEAAMELPMEQVSWVLAAADDDAYNSLVCLRFGPELGRERVLQLSAGRSERELKSHMTGRCPWGEHASFGAISSRFWRGGAFRIAVLDEKCAWADLRAAHPDALFLFALVGTRLAPIEAVGGATAPRGAKVIYLDDAPRGAVAAPMSEPLPVAEPVG